MTTPLITSQPSTSKDVFTTKDLNVSYGTQLAIRDINISIQRNMITAIIGPSGCGKSTLLRSFNRMNELIPGTITEGEVFYNGMNIYTPGTDPVGIRRRIGMVFQKPNP
ncbi:MAG: ATP-binding cassette domain-containing protein, partial [Anaerolineaceae bacterium]|nr:ATP-binding cassette domain-containing protein [Anaerolineaceae bacterium]